jgi:hypothetical protein
MEHFDALGGVEVWNYMSSWKRGISPFNFFPRVRNPDPLNTGPNPLAVSMWLENGGCAVACPDAHALRVGIGRFSTEVFPYAMLFRRLRTHLLLPALPDWEDAAGTERAIIQALREGRTFSSNRLLGDASGFRAARSGNTLSLELPAPAGVLLHTGAGTSNAGNLPQGRSELETGPGPVMVTVERERGTWILCGLA